MRIGNNDATKNRQTYNYTHRLSPFPQCLDKVDQVIGIIHLSFQNFGKPTRIQAISKEEKQFSRQQDFSFEKNGASIKSLEG